MTALASPQQVRAIQSARAGAGLRDDAAYRAALQGFGVVSTKELTTDQATAFLKELNGGRSPSQRLSKHRADGDFAKKLQVMWIAGWNLGVIRDNRDTALHAWIQEKFGISHTRFLRDAKDGARAVDGLRAWLARDGAVAWPKKKGPGSIELKRAIVEAQIRRLAGLGLTSLGLPVPSNDQVPISLAGLSGPELDNLSRRLGVALRKALAEAAR